MRYVPRFREVRVAAGVTQQEAAARVGRSQSAIQKWEQGANSPTMDDIRRLASAYHVEPYIFFSPDNLPVMSARENKTVIFDTNVIANLPDAGRETVIARLRDCYGALLAVPDDFADHWIAALKACASAVAGNSGAEGSKQSHEAGDPLEEPSSSKPTVRRNKRSARQVRSRAEGDP
jgi:transcriptional regulator with XRE-family HTH domain